MKRIHLFEFEDQKWFPTFLRNYGTDFLQFLSNKTKMYKPIVPVLVEVLKKSKTSNIIDLGSGGGGGWMYLNPELKKEIENLKITFTDYHPNIPAFELTQKQSDNFHFVRYSVDAREVPKKLQGIKTLFLSFHHFKPNDAQKILQNAINNNTSIAIFEAQERSFTSILAMLFSPLSVFLTTPFIRPFKIGRIIFTYMIPIVPLFVLWDGIVSSLRTYSAKEMTQLIEELENKNSFEWKINKIKSGPSVILYLLGIKKES